MRPPADLAEGVEVQVAAKKKGLGRGLDALLPEADELLPNVVLSLANSNISASHDYYYNLVQANTALLLAVLPLLILYVLFQRQIIAGIERSGLVE